MRYLALSDLDSDGSALQAVLEDAEGCWYRLLLLLGELVGYGNEPRESVEGLRSLSPMVTVRSHQEWMLARLNAADGPAQVCPQKRRVASPIGA